MNHSSSPNNYPSLHRRKFIANSLLTAGALLTMPVINKATGINKINETYTVGDILDLFIKEVPGGVRPNTVDTLKAGNRNIPVTGIATTMFATVEVIRKAIDLGANFII